MQGLLVNKKQRLEYHQMWRFLCTHVIRDSMREAVSHWLCWHSLVWSLFMGKIPWYLSPAHSEFMDVPFRDSGDITEMSIGLVCQLEAFLKWRWTNVVLGKRVLDRWMIHTVQPFHSYTSRPDICQCLVVQTTMGNTSKNKPNIPMTHVACESKRRSVVRWSMHPWPGNLLTIGRVVVYYARAAYEFSTGIKCRHCTRCWKVWYFVHF